LHGQYSLEDKLHPLLVYVSETRIYKEREREREREREMEKTGEIFWKQEKI
jgi:hypothetical protein